MRELIPLAIPKTDSFHESLLSQVILEKQTKILNMGGHDTFSITSLDNIQRLRIMHDLMDSLGRKRVTDYIRLVTSPTQEVKVSRVRELLPFSMTVAIESGLPADIILAQAILESGWRGTPHGRSYFGISDKRLGKQAKFSTEEEYVRGKRTKVVKSFNVYDRTIDAFRDYARFIFGNPRYRDVLSGYFKNGSSYDYIKGIKAKGYATASNYVSSVWNVRESIMNIIRATPISSMVRCILNPFNEEIMDYDKFYHDVHNSIQLNTVTNDWRVKAV